MTSAIQAEAARPRSAKKEKKPSSGKLQRNLEILVLSGAGHHRVRRLRDPAADPRFLYYGFYRWKGFGMPSETGEFAGIDNYITAFKDPTFQAAIGHTFIVVVGSLVIQAPIAILFALLLNQKFKGRGLVRTLIFVPYVISEVIVGTGWSLLLQKTGAVNELLSYIGIDGPDWLADPKIAMITLLVIISWKYNRLRPSSSCSPACSPSPRSMYEAAKGGRRRILADQWSITLPLLAPTLRIWVFLSMIGSLQLFDLVYIIWGSYISETAGVSTMATYMVRNGRDSGNKRLRSAVAIFILHHLPGRGARLPEVRAQPRSGGSSDRREAGQEARRPSAPRKRSGWLQAR